MPILALRSNGLRLIRRELGGAENAYPRGRRSASRRRACNTIGLHAAVAGKIRLDIHDRLVVYHHGHVGGYAVCIPIWPERQRAAWLHHRIYLLLDWLHARSIVSRRAQQYLPDRWWAISYVTYVFESSKPLLRRWRLDWVSELAPSRLRRPLSYMTGWLLVLGWQADLASAAYLGGIIIQGIAALNYPDYQVERWQVSRNLLRCLVMY